MTKLFFSTSQHLLTISQQMLSLAQQAQWEQLLSAENGYQQAVCQVTALGSITTPPASLPHRLSELLQEILTNESEIRQLMKNRMNELVALIKQDVQQQQVYSYYSEYE